MDINIAKKIDLPDLMLRLGYRPTRTIKDGKELWYLSPFRNEKEASFHTSYLGGKWIWFDFGDTGGTVIDFVMRHENYSDVRDALAFLRNIYRGKGKSSVSKSSQRKTVNTVEDRDGDQTKYATRLEFVSDSALTSKVVLSYLRNRSIDDTLAKEYLRLVRYRDKNNATNRLYYSLGQKNLSGGWEIRSASDGRTRFKTALVVRDISVHFGTTQHCGVVSVFEGMIDHLSLLKMLNVNRLTGDSIVLNSTSSYDRAVGYIRLVGYHTINTFLDNDRAGKALTERFKQEFGDNVHDWSPKFHPHKDLNDALCSQQSFNFGN